MGAVPQQITDHDRPADDNARRRLLAGVGVTERRLELAAIPTAVLEGGHGPPLVLLHSSGEFAALWQRVIPGLAAAHSVVVRSRRPRLWVSTDGELERESTPLRYGVMRGALRLLVPAGDPKSDLGSEDVRLAASCPLDSDSRLPHSGS